jgi:hypothetical protein
MFIITIDHKRWRQQSKRRNIGDRRYCCFLEVGHTRSDLQRLMRSCINTTHNLAFAGSNPLPTGLKSTDSGTTGLTHYRGTFGDTVLDTRRKTWYGRNRPTPETVVAAEEGSESTWRATRRGGDGGVALTDVSIG